MHNISWILAVSTETSPAQLGPCFAAGAEESRMADTPRTEHYSHYQCCRRSIGFTITEKAPTIDI